MKLGEGDGEGDPGEPRPGPDVEDPKRPAGPSGVGRGARAFRTRTRRGSTIVGAGKMPACRVFFGVSGETAIFS